MSLKSNDVEEFYENQFNEMGMSSQRLYPNEEFIRFFSKFVKNNRDKSSTKIIELGCGLSSNLIPVIENGFETFGIDISKESIELSKNRINNLNLKANLIVGNCLNKNFGFDFKFDIVFDVFSMYCFNEENFLELLKNIYDSLNEDGLFYSFFPSKNSQAFTNHKPAKLIDNSTLNGIYRETSPYYGNFYTFQFLYPYEYKNLLEKVGFEVIELNTISRNHNMQETFEHISITSKKK
jgi:SAM-dependent methyltransferase